MRRWISGQFAALQFGVSLGSHAVLTRILQDSTFVAVGLHAETLFGVLVFRLRTSVLFIIINVRSCETRVFASFTKIELTQTRCER